MSIAASDVPSGPTTKDHPDLIERLFVIQQEGDDQWLFRTAGVQLQSSLGRELADHDFFSCEKCSEILDIEDSISVEKMLHCERCAKIATEST